MMQALLPFFKWCDGSAAGQAIRDSRVLFPIIESFHLFALTVLLGTVIVMNLRLLGAALRQQPVAQVARTLSPLTFWSMIVMLVTGFLLFASEAMKCYENPPFLFKMVALFTAIIFQYAVFGPMARSENAPGPGRAKTMVVASLVLWFGVAIAGRAIGFY